MHTPYTPDEIEQLPWIKRNVDNGKQPFIYDEQGRRWGFSADMLKEFGFISGQTLTHEQVMELLKTCVAKAKMQLALAKAGCFPKE